MKSVPLDSFEKVFGNKQRVLVVTAHPDDNEVICGGIVARLISSGRAVRLVVVTNGEKGMENRSIALKKFASIRISEQLLAGTCLGLSEDQNFNLGISDGELEASVDNIEKIVWHIREFRPDIVITHNPDEVINTFSASKGIRWINHRDHRHSALITVDAVYPYSRDRGFFSDHFARGLEPHTVTELLLADSYTHALNLCFDITDFIEQKRSALAACKSVIPPDHVDEYIDETKIGNRYYERLRYVPGL